MGDASEAENALCAVVTKIPRQTTVYTGAGGSKKKKREPRRDYAWAASAGMVSGMGMISTDLWAFLLNLT